MKPDAHPRHDRLAAKVNPAAKVMWRLLGLGIGAFLLLGAAPGRATQTSPPARIAINEIQVNGNTVLPQEQIEEAVYPYLGPGRTPADVERARAALEALYQNAGYATVTATVPRQIVNPYGIYVIDIVERPVERLRVTGARYFLPSAVRAGAPSVAPGQVPNMNAVQADLLGLNGLPDRVVSPALRPGRTPDTVDVDLQVQDNLPLHGSLELNNRYNADTTHLRLNASLSYDNFFQRGDSGTIAYQVAPENIQDAEIVSASYLFHVPDSKLSLLFSYLHSNSRVTALGSTQVAGRGTQAGFRLLIPLGSTSSFSHSFSVGWDYKKYYELDTFLTTTQLQSAPITYYPLNAGYVADWTGEKSTTELTLGLEFDIADISASADTFYNKRQGATPSFALARAGVTRTQDLPYHTQLYVNAQGQVSNQPLVSSEQIGIGGTESVRGYLESEALGDYGAYIQTELRSPSIAKQVGGPVHSWKFHVFADGGVIDQRQAAGGTPATTSLSSVGVGTRVNLWGYLDGTLQDALALNRGPNTPSGSNRVLFSLKGEF